MRVSLSSWPSPKTQMVTTLAPLNGGLNLWELDYRVDANQSPEMKNLWWEDGILQGRKGQRRLTDGQDRGAGHAMAQDLFAGKLIAHIGTGLYAVDPESGQAQRLGKTEGEETRFPTVPAVRGTFFRFGDALYYKTTGFYGKITAETGEDGTVSLACTEVVSEASYLTEENGTFIPTICTGADPATGSGTAYQPENRLQPKKTLRYTVTAEVKVDTSGLISIQGIPTVYQLPVGDIGGVSEVRAKGQYVAAGATGSGAMKPMTYAQYTAAYSQDPAGVEYKEIIYTGGAEFADKAAYEAAALPEGTPYAVLKKEGQIIFQPGYQPQQYYPTYADQVSVTYTKGNEEAFKSILECRYAADYGGDTSLCAVLAGSSAQPNAFFWSGHGENGVDCTYFPVDHYNLAGDTDEPVTGFGRQQAMLIVLKKSSVGKVSCTLETVAERTEINLPYVPVNDRMGCDLPWTIQLVDNNLVWCSTKHGVCTLLSTSAANENNVMAISRNVDGTAGRSGLLADVRAAGSDQVTALDDGQRYWLCAGGHVYLWDYLLRGYASPGTDPAGLSWFYFEGVNGLAFARFKEDVWHLDGGGQVTAFQSRFADYDKAIPVSYRFSVQAFETYRRLKNVEQVTLLLRADQDSKLYVTYETDYGTRVDKTPVLAYSWRLSPRNLSHRALQVMRYGFAAVRRPGCRHVRHFGMVLSNMGPEETASERTDPARHQSVGIVSAQIQYDLQGVER